MGPFFRVATSALCVTLVGSTAGAAPTPRALIVSIQNYRDARGFGPLPFAANDAANVARALLKQGFSSANVTIASDQDPEQIYLVAREARQVGFAPVRDLGDIVRKMSEVVSRVQSEDVVLFYFSGHGAVFGGHRYFAVPGSDFNEPSTMLPIVNIESKLGEPIGAHKLLIMDTCANKSSPQSQSLQHPNPEETQVNKLFSSRLGSPSYWDPLLRGSIFTTHFGRALSRTALPKEATEVSVDGLAGYLENQVVTYSQRRAQETQNTDNVIGNQHPQRFVVDSFVLGHLKTTP